MRPLLPAASRCRDRRPADWRWPRPRWLVLGALAVALSSALLLAEQAGDRTVVDSRHGLRQARPALAAHLPSPARVAAAERRAVSQAAKAYVPLALGIRWPFGQEVDLLITEIDVAPATLEAFPREPLRLRIQHTAGGRRGLMLALGRGEGSLVQIDPLSTGQSTIVELLAPEEPGFYPYWSPQIVGFQGGIRVVSTRP